MITDNEKIAKAYEIYYKRNGLKYKKEKKKTTTHFFRNFIILIILISSLILIKNKEKISKLNLKKEINNILNKEISISALTTEKNILNETIDKIEEKENKEEKIIWPYKGEITSRFGHRESENEKLNGNHTGIDIAGEYGTDIISSISGKVTKVSSEGNLGNHIEIKNEKYTSIYAHCSEIYVKEGEQVEQGTVIAAIGNTGNSTRKSFTF